MTKWRIRIPTWIPECWKITKLFTLNISKLIKGYFFKAHRFIESGIFRDGHTVVFLNSWRKRMVVSFCYLWS